MSGAGIGLAILGLVCLHAALGTHRAGCERRDTYLLLGIGVAASGGSALFFV
jgi:hypothetical protein